MDTGQELLSWEVTKEDIDYNKIKRYYLVIHLVIGIGLYIFGMWAILKYGSLFLMILLFVAIDVIVYFYMVKNLNDILGKYVLTDKGFIKNGQLREWEQFDSITFTSPLTSGSAAIQFPSPTVPRSSNIHNYQKINVSKSFHKTYSIWCKKEDSQKVLEIIKSKGLKESGL